MIGGKLAGLLFMDWIRETFLFCQGCRGDKNCETNIYCFERTVCPTFIKN
jgi:hypothetical protein